MKLEWKTITVVINELLPYEHNPRQLTDKEAKDLTESIEKFNLVEIPVVDFDQKRLIAGHQRLKIMQILGRGNETTDCRVPNRQLTDKEFREYLIRSNKTTGSWDMDILANNFEVIDLKAWGFDDWELGIHNPQLPDVNDESTKGLAQRLPEYKMVKIEMSVQPVTKEKFFNEIDLIMKSKTEFTFIEQALDYMIDQYKTTIK